MATTVTSAATAPPLQGTVTSNGTGSGLDVQGIVQKLVAAEGAPQSTRLDAAEAAAQAKVSALGSLRSALSSFQDSLAKVKDLTTFQGRKVVLSSEEFLSATASSTAVPATYSVEVEQLAQAQKLQSTSFASSSAVVGTGTLTITSGGKTFNVVIDSTNNTVAKIAAAINSSDAGTKVVATVINGANGTATLTLTARTSGTANALTVSQTGGDGGLAAIQYPKSGGSGLTQIVEPLDARAKIDGVEVTSATNTITGAIDGVQIDLQKANDPGDTSTVTVQYDQPGARTLIDSLVKSYNGVVDAVKSVASYDASAQKAGPLFGDLGVSNLVAPVAPRARLAGRGRRFVGEHADEDWRDLRSRRASQRRQHEARHGIERELQRRRHVVRRQERRASGRASTACSVLTSSPAAYSTDATTA